MWDVPRYRIRAYVRALKKARTKQLDPQRHSLHLARTLGEIRVTEGFATPTTVVPAQIVLNELRPTGLYLFSSESFRPGQLVSLTLTDPRRFFVRGRVIACHRTAFDSNVISESPHPYRVAVLFEFQNHFERDSVRRFVQDLSREVLYAGDTAAVLSAL